MKRKIRAITFYLLWGIFLVLVLSFGTSVARKIVSNIKDVYNSSVQSIVIEDISLNTKEPYRINQGYYLDFNVTPKINHDYGFLYESLSPDIFEVKANGYIISYDTDNEEVVGKLKVTSKYDLKFSKILDIKFEKKYPESMNILIRGNSYNIENNIANVGIPIFIYAQYPKEYSYYSETKIEYEYDEEYLEHISGTKFMPLKETENTTIICRFKDKIEKVVNISIKPELKAIDSIDQIKLVINNKNVNSEDAMCNTYQGYPIKLFKDGKEVHSDYTVSYPEKKGYMNSLNYLTFYSAGDHKIIITLPNGFAFETIIKFRNKLYLPTLKDVDYVAGNTIELTEQVVDVINYSLPTSARVKTLKFEYDKEILKVSVRGNSQIVINPIGYGVTNLRIYLDDGFDTVETNIVVCVQRNPHAIKDFVSNLPKVVAKVGGHMFLFCVLAIFAIIMLNTFNFYNRLFKGIIFIFCGLIFAGLTEYIQKFLPGRNPAYKDIAIDMSGYMIGFIIYSLWVRHRRIKRIRIQIKDNLKADFENKRILHNQDKIRKKLKIDVASADTKIEDKAIGKFKQKIISIKNKQWSFKISKTPVIASYFNNADLLLTADCAGYAYYKFHQDFSNDYVVLTACGKDSDENFLMKLTRIIKYNNINSITILRMENSCCDRFENTIKAAVFNSGKIFEIKNISISIAGSIIDAEFDKKI